MNDFSKIIPEKHFNKDEIKTNFLSKKLLQLEFKARTNNIYSEFIKIDIEGDQLFLKDTSHILNRKLDDICNEYNIQTKEIITFKENLYELECIKNIKIYSITKFCNDKKIIQKNLNVSELVKKIILFEECLDEIKELCKHKGFKDVIDYIDLHIEDTYIKMKKYYDNIF